MQASGAAQEQAAQEQAAKEKERLENRRRKLREAQRRYYDLHKRKKDPENPCPSYCPEHIRACKRAYYAQHRDEIIARSKQRYHDKKAAANAAV
jgi:hypothetical protein